MTNGQGNAFGGNGDNGNGNSSVAVFPTVGGQDTDWIAGAQAALEAKLAQRDTDRTAILASLEAIGITGDAGLRASYIMAGLPIPEGL